MPVLALVLNVEFKKGAHDAENELRASLLFVSNLETLLNIFIPLCGIGTRFANYYRPKPLVKALGRPILFWVIEKLKITSSDTVRIIYSQDLNRYNFPSLLEKTFPDVRFNFICVSYPTRGAAETLLCGLNTLGQKILEQPIMVMDGDTFYEDDVVTTYKQVQKNAIFYFEQKSTEPIFSYIIIKNGKVKDIQEKERISQNACSGCYCFESANIAMKYCKKIISENFKSKNEFYISNVYKQMLKEGNEISSIKVGRFHCLGTPAQVQSFCAEYADTGPSLRICFDLDNTLVSYPTIRGDYSTVKPLKQNIETLRNLKKLGHTIIIYTARRMLTHKGNVGSILADVGEVTLETLRSFDIPYDELHFGKPFAHFYIDDLAINPAESLDNQLGFYSHHQEPRGFNKIVFSGGTVTKSSSHPDFPGEMYWYNNVPSSIKGLFPSATVLEESIEMEHVKGVVVSSLFVNYSFQKKQLVQILDALRRIHSSSQVENTALIYENYAKKFARRLDKYTLPSEVVGAEKAKQAVSEFLVTYESEKRAVPGVIHGDPVLTNVIFDANNKVKFIDMRGMQGDTLTLSGDCLYDFSKVFQSLCGYDFILSDRTPEADYVTQLKGDFRTYIISFLGKEAFNDIQMITASLFLSLLPLHKQDLKIAKYISAAIALVSQSSSSNNNVAA